MTTNGFSVQNQQYRGLLKSRDICGLLEAIRAKANAGIAPKTEN